MNKKTVCITGATGTMGLATLREFMPRLDRFRLRLLARPSKVNEKKLAPFLANGDVEVIWGNLTNLADVKRAVEGADYVLHIGGMVSPAADRYPEKTLEVNVKSAENVARAVLESDNADTCAVVYIGSIAQLGDRRPPYHWGRTGDPLTPSAGDAYALSKVRAEKAIVDSGLKKWVSLRQTGILCPALVKKGSDPITFHVPLHGVLEWATDEDSGRLMANICEDAVPEEFWNRFYNIGSGESYRLTNYEFEKLFLDALHCPPVEKAFKADWFALKNFHGQWWQDSDELERLVPFRSHETCDEYFCRMSRMLPWFFRLAPLAPAPLVRWGMKFVASRPPRGPLSWRNENDTDKIAHYFGSKEAWDAIPGWDTLLPELEKYPQGEPRGSRVPPASPSLSHGYDESKPLDELTLDDMRQKAAFHGGRCLTVDAAAAQSDGQALATKVSMSEMLEWECSEGHRFMASPAAVLLGGHWCPDCLTRSVLG